MNEVFGKNFDLSDLKKISKEVNERVKENLIERRQYAESSKFLKESLCYYDKETDEELDVSELIEAFLFSAFDFEKNRSNIDYLITDPIKEEIDIAAIYNPKSRRKSKNWRKNYTKEHLINKNFDIFTVDEVSSRCEEELFSKSLSKTSKQKMGEGSNKDSQSKINYSGGIGERKKSREGYKMIILPSRSLEKSLGESNFKDKDVASMSLSLNKRNGSIGNEVNYKSEMKKKRKMSQNDEKILKKIFEDEASNGLKIVTSQVVFEENDDKFLSPEIEKKEYSIKEEEESDDQTTFQVKIDKNLDIKIEKMEGQKISVTSFSKEIEKETDVFIKETQNEFGKNEDLLDFQFPKTPKNKEESKEKKEGKVKKKSKKGRKKKLNIKTSSSSNNDQIFPLKLKFKNSIDIKNPKKIPKLNIGVINSPKMKNGSISDRVFCTKYAVSKKNQNKTKYNILTNNPKTIFNSARESPRAISRKIQNSKNFFEIKKTQESKPFVNPLLKKSKSSSNSDKVREKSRIKKIEYELKKSTMTNSFARSVDLNEKNLELSSLKKDRIKRNRRKIRKNSLLYKLKSKTNRSRRSLRNSHYSYSTSRDGLILQEFDKSNVKNKKKKYDDFFVNKIKIENEEGYFEKMGRKSSMSLDIGEKQGKKRINKKNKVIGERVSKKGKNKTLNPKYYNYGKRDAKNYSGNLLKNLIKGKESLFRRPNISNYTSNVNNLSKNFEKKGFNVQKNLLKSNTTIKSKRIFRKKSSKIGNRDNKKNDQIEKQKIFSSNFVTPRGSKTARIKRITPKTTNPSKKRIKKISVSIETKKRNFSSKNNQGIKEKRMKSLGDVTHWDLKKKVTTDIGNYFGIDQDDEDNKELTEKILGLIQEFKVRKMKKEG